MDRLPHTQTPLSSDIPQNLSFKDRYYNLPPETTQGNDGFGNRDYGQRSEFSVYCMSDATGRLHFNLSAYPESTLNALEQRNLGRQLSEYVTDHYEKYKKTHETFEGIDFSGQNSEWTGVLLRALYDDFITHYPILSLSHQTYVEALFHLSSLKRKPLSRPFPSVPQSSLSNHSSRAQRPSSPKPPHLSDANYSPSPANGTSSGLATSHEGAGRPEADGEKVEENERQVHQSSDQLIIPRWESAVSFNDKTLSDESCPPVAPRLPHPPQVAVHKEKRRRWKENVIPVPLPTKCSCPTSKCVSLFPEVERKQICKNFWRGKNVNGSFKWVGASMQGPFSCGLKSYSRFCKRRQFYVGRYFLHKQAAGKQEVCKHFFLATLGLQFLYPLYDVLKQKDHKTVKPKKESRSESHLLDRRKSKKKSMLKYFMKKHVDRHFLQHHCHAEITISSVVSQAKKSFKHFYSQHPHLVDIKSFKKYLSVIRKALKLKKPRSKDSQSSSSMKIKNKMSSDVVGASEAASKKLASDSSGPDEKIMAIKAEAFDEVISHDMIEDFEDACETRYLGHCGEKQSSLESPHNSPQVPVPLEENESYSEPVNADDAKSAESTLLPEPSGSRKVKKGPYKKGKRGRPAKEKKVEKKVKKKSSDKDKAPKKVYKIAVNELEDDQTKHPMLPPCKCSKGFCLDKVLEEQRQIIHADFWNLDNISRRAWMVKHVHILKPKSRSNLPSARLHKMHRKFFLPDSSGQLHDVCKRFFLATLGFKGVGVLRPQKVPGEKEILLPKEARKRVLSYQICQQDVVSVIEYCQSFNKEKDVKFCGDDRFTRPSNNNKEASGDVQRQNIFVPYGFTWKELFRDYCTKHSNVEFGYQTFRSILNLVDQNNFSEDLLDKFQIFLNSDAESVEQYFNESQENAESEPSKPSSVVLQEQFRLLQSFPKIQKTPAPKIEKSPTPKVQKTPTPKVQKKPAKRTATGREKKPVIMERDDDDDFDDDYDDEVERKKIKPRKKLKLSKSFLSPDFTQTVKSYKPRTTDNSRYNFRRGVSHVSYNLDDVAAPQDDDDAISNDWEDTEYNDIKEEIISDEEKPKKTVKKTVVSKKSARLPMKKRKKHKHKRIKPAPIGDELPNVEDSMETEVDGVVDVPVKKKSKRGRKRKIRLYTKQEESTMKFKSRHPILPPCKCNYRKCHEKIPEAQREQIHSLYWGISSKQGRCKWVLDHLKRRSPKTRCNTHLPSRKRETRRYYFPNEQGETVEVCRVFFLRTLGYHWDSVVDTVSRALPRPGGHLAKSLGFSDEHFPFEVIVHVKSFLKRKKIRKSPLTADSFPKDESFTEENAEGEELEDFTLQDYSMKELFADFTKKHSEHNLDFRAFVRISQFILVPSSEAQTEWEIKQEQLHGPFGDGNRGGLEDGAFLGDVEARNPDGSLVTYFTPEFEKEDVEKALNRKARRRRPLSARNCKEQHPMREPCSCVRKCREKIDEKKREEIHQHYWDLITYNQRKQWILEHITRAAPKRRTNLNGPIKKTETRKFYLENWSGRKIEICKGFFLATLGFKWDKMVDTICKTTPKDGRYVRPDQRGKKPPSHKLSEALITSVSNYVESILETASCVAPKPTGKTASGKPKKTPDRMPYGLTMKNLFEDYKIKHSNHKVGYESFRKIYRSVVQSDKFRPMSSSPSHQLQDEEDDMGLDHLSDSPPPQMATAAAAAPTLATSIENTSSDRASVEHSVPSFDTANQSCMYKNQTGAMRLHNPQQAHLAPYQRHCEASTVMKSFPEGINSFPKSHDVPPFFTPSLEQSEEMSMQMYKSICLPSSNPHQSYAFYPNSLPLDSFAMGSGGSQGGPHAGLPYSETLRHSDLMHHHPYQTPHHHFAQGRFPGFMFPGSSSVSSKEVDPTSHHQHQEMNLSGHNYRNDFDCNAYPSKNPLVYPPPYQGAAAVDGMPSSSSTQRHYNNLQTQNHAVHQIRAHNSNAVVTAAPTTAPAAANLLINDSSSSNPCHIPTSVQSSHSSMTNEWASHLTSPQSREPFDTEPSQKINKKAKGRPSKRKPKEKIPKVKKERKVRPKSNRNSKEHNPMLPPCGCTAKKCRDKIPEPRREEIYNMFWDLGNYNDRKQWIAEHIKREDPKRRTSLDNPLRRMETRRFYLPNSKGEKLEVCKGHFLRTLGFKWDKMVDTICKTTEKGQTTVRPDMRGKKGPSHKLNPDVALSIENYVRAIMMAAKPTYDADLAQGKEPELRGNDKDVFIPYGLTMKNFHEDYKGKHAHHKVGYESFRKIYRRVSKEVFGPKSLKEDDDNDNDKDDTGAEASSAEAEESDAINPITGLPQ